MNSAFALVLTVFLVSGVPVDIAVSVHRTMQECMTAATEQKIPGNCYPVDKVIHQDIININTLLVRFASAVDGVESPLIIHTGNEL
ncbi:DUF1482 family protein [Escherichia coli]|nr:DUF1482 family protein [Escherichia coli]WHH01497.1 DUF1482 family protein [Escherichia coli]